MKVYWTDLYSIEHRAYDNIDLNEEKQNEIVIEEKEKTIEEKFAFREQLFFYASLSLSVFALAVMVDLFWLVCWKKGMRVVRIELTTFGLWDQRSSNWAKPAAVNCHNHASFKTREGTHSYSS